MYASFANAGSNAFTASQHHHWNAYEDGAPFQTPWMTVVVFPTSPTGAEFHMQPLKTTADSAAGGAATNGLLRAPSAGGRARAEKQAVQGAALAPTAHFASHGEALLDANLSITGGMIVQADGRIVLGAQCTVASRRASGTVERDFDFFRAHQAKQTDPAPYIRIAAEARF